MRIVLVAGPHGPQPQEDPMMEARKLLVIAAVALSPAAALAGDGKAPPPLPAYGSLLPPDPGKKVPAVLPLEPAAADTVKVPPVIPLTPAADAKVPPVIPLAPPADIKSPDASAKVPPVIPLDPLPSQL